MKQRKTQATLGAALATSVLATALMTAAPVANAKSTERCAGVVKAGKNDCAIKAIGSSCQGSAPEDNMANSWIKVPAGTCANIVTICAGDAEAPEGTKEKRLKKACGKLAEQSDDSVAGGILVDKFGEPI